MVWEFVGVVLFVAAVLGVFTYAMCKVASDADELLEYWHQHRMMDEVATTKECETECR